MSIIVSNWVFVNNNWYRYTPDVFRIPFINRNSEENPLVGNITPPLQFNFLLENYCSVLNLNKSKR